MFGGRKGKCNVDQCHPSSELCIQGIEAGIRQTIMRAFQFLSLTGLLLALVSPCGQHLPHHFVLKHLFV